MSLITSKDTQMYCKLVDINVYLSSVLGVSSLQFCPVQTGAMQSPLCLKFGPFMTSHGPGPDFTYFVFFVFYRPDLIFSKLV